MARKLTTLPLPLSPATLGLLFALGLGLWLLLLPPSFLPAGSAPAAAFMLVVLSLWATGIIAEYLTALLFFTGAMLLGLAPPAVIFSGFTSAAFWLILGGLVLGVAINVTGLGKRVAARVADHLGASYGRLLFGLVFAGILFALLMPSSLGRVVLLVPIAISIAEQFGFARGSKGYTGMILATVLGCFLPGFATLPANVPNMVLVGLSETLYGYTPLYGEYLLLHFPILGLLKALLLTVILLILFPDSISRQQGPRPKTPTAPAERGEKILGVVLGVLLLLWIFDFLHHISPAWVAMAGACIVMLPPVGIVTSRLFQEKINFGSLFYICGILGLGQLINHTGLGGVLAEQCIRVLPLAEGQTLGNFFSLAVLSLFTGLFTTQPGIPAVLTPFAGELAAASGLSVQAVLMTQVLGFSQPLFPYQVPPLLIGMKMTGVPLAEAFKVCLLLVLASLLILFPLDYLWWQLLGWL